MEIKGMKKSFQLSLIMHAMLVMGMSCSAYATESQENTEATEDEEVEFNNVFLSKQPIDVSRFSKGNPVIAGKYSATVTLNDKERGKFDIEFKENPKQPLRAIPCLNVKTLIALGIDLKAIDYSAESEDESACKPLPELIPQASWKMDINEQRLNVKVPQVLVSEQRDDVVPETLWEDGMTAAFASYNANYYHSSYSGIKSDSGWVGIDGGLNVLGWRARVRGDANYSEEEGTTFDSSNLYVEHDVARLKSQLRVGEIYSSSTFFDAFPLRGVTLSSDTRMLPDSMNAFRPVIRGVAESNAKVTIKQAGQKILETTVPPGAFAIDNYNPISTSEQLDVTIEEADGRTRQLAIPYNGGGQLLYPGVSVYSLAYGEYDGYTTGDKPLVAQGTWQYGVNNFFSVYSGAEYMTDYYAAIFGVALNTPVGAVSLDATHSSMDGRDGKKQGQSYGITYNSFINPTNTSFNITAYRYSTKDYYTLSEAVDSLNETEWYDREDRLKSRFQLSVSQALEEGWGSFYTTATLAEYWQTSRKEKSYQLGYSNNIGRVGYSISVNRYYTEDNEKDDQLYLSLSIPLGNAGIADEAPLFNYLNTSYTTDNDHNSSLSASASGYNQNANLNYGVNANYRKSNGSIDSEVENIGGNISWDNRYGTLGANVSSSTDDSSQLSLTASGGILVHSGGITFGKTISGDSPVALIEAKGAKGAQAQNDPSVRINNAGYAYISNLSAYHFNEVGIDPAKMEADTEFKQTSTKVVPRAGAIIYVPFETDDRRSVLFRLKMASGKNIPMGAEIYSKDNAVGYVGQSSRAFTRGVEQSGVLSVIWGNKPEEQCRFSYEIPVAVDDVTQQTLSIDNVICK